MLYDGQEDIAKIEFEYYKEDIDISTEWWPEIARKGFDRDSLRHVIPKMAHLYSTFRMVHFWVCYYHAT